MAEPLPLGRLRTLVVTPKGFLGGAERWLLAVLAASDRWDVAVVCLDDGPLVGELRARGIPVRVVPTGPRPQDLVRSAAVLRRILRASDPDVLLANGIKAAVTALPVARAAGVPAVWVRHDPNYDSTLGAAAARLARATVVVAPPDEIETRRFRPVHIPPPLLTRPLSAAAARRRLAQLGVPDDGLARVGMFCRLARYKGVDTAIAALADAPGWRLVVAGVVDPGEAGDEAQRLRDLAATHGVADRVSWLGEVPDAGELAAGLDAMALLTRAGVPGYPDAEGFGMTLVEAYAAGVPAIGDPRTVPPLREPGFAAAAVMVDATDPLAVAAGLAALPARQGELSRAAERAAATHPGPAEVAERLATVLAAAAHRPGAGLSAGPSMSVVCTVFNEGGAADRVARQFLAQASVGDEVIIVDGGSTDDTVDRLREVAKDDSRLEIIEAPGAGIAQGRNIGIAAAHNEWVACSDAGCELAPTWLAGLRAGAASGTADLVTGVYRAAVGHGRVWETGMCAVAYPEPAELRRETPLITLYGRLFGRVFDPELPTGRSVAFTRAAWRSAGGYPEHLATGEDVTYGKEIVHRGGRAVLAADAAVVWGQRETLSDSLRMLYRYGIGDGESRSPLLVSRNVGRAAAYVAGPAMLISPRLRPVALALAGLYLSVPVLRAVRGPRPVATLAAVPALSAARDLSKVAGCIVGLRRGR